MMFSYDQSTCVPRIQNCRVSIAVQPTGLRYDREKDIWACDSCIGGYYWDGYECSPCGDAIPYCTQCNTATHCTACEDSRVPNFNTCDVYGIPYCLERSTTDGQMCSMC